MRVSALTTVSLGFLVAAGFAACQSEPFHRETRALDQRDAGSVHVTVLAVAPWSHYVDALTPRFTMSADDAVGKVIRDTRQSMESRQSSVSTGASATEKPGMFGAPTGPDPVKASVFAAVPDKLEGPDAMMEVWTANSLYQEVQILNRVLRDAVIPTGFRPYLVRLQVSLIPRRRHQPYDAYTTLSFFSPEVQIAAAGSTPAPRSAPSVSLRSGGVSGESTGGTGPVVLPLLVTDNLESSLVSRSQQDAQRLALSLLALPGDFAGKLTADLFANEFQGQVAGRDLNSLLTMARVSPNTLRVRIGAMAESTADYAMVPRNHNVTLLVMVPEKSEAEVELVARTSLVDTQTGIELADSSPERVAALLEGVGSRWGLQGLGAPALEELFRLAQSNDQSRFQKRLNELASPTSQGAQYPQSLWIELVGLVSGSQFTSTRFELPGHGAGGGVPASLTSQTLVVLDYGWSRCETIVRDAAFPENAKLRAFLEFDDNGRVISLPADALQVDAEKQTLRLVFTSLLALNMSGPAAIPGNLRIRLNLDGDDLPAFSALYLPGTTAPPAAQTPKGS
ncbi:MAG: hypothetical protein NTY35_10085 [Planctomycetota bacterium]|nr:hypothetical protein [Planctomycetota bacterium]